MARKHSKKSIDWNKYLPIIVIFGVVIAVVLVSFSPSGKFFDLGPMGEPDTGLDLASEPGLPDESDFPKGEGMTSPDKEELFDNDLDGYPASQDCDDNDPTRWAWFYDDVDRDSYGAPSPSYCLWPSWTGNYVNDNTDCDDNNANVHAEWTYSIYDDLDEDGYGDDSTVVKITKCGLGIFQPPAGKVVKGGDTDDSDPTLPEFEEFYTSFTHTATPISQGGGGTAVWQDRNNDGVQSMPIGTIFLTTNSDPYFGNLAQVPGATSGLSGADILCKEEALDTSHGKAVFEGKWFALLGDSNTNAMARVQNVKFRDVYGRLIAQDKSQLSATHYPKFPNLMEYTSFGWSWNDYRSDSTFQRHIWTGRWTIWGSNCGDWTSTSGNGGVVMSRHNYMTGQGCSSGAPLMCVRMETEQICTDGIDNDADGRIDCKDLDCVNDPAC